MSQIGQWEWAHRRCYTNDVFVLDEIEQRKNEARVCVCTVYVRVRPNGLHYAMSSICGSSLAFIWCIHIHTMW